MDNLSNNRTLFLDRDGVINERLPGQYVRSFDQFSFLPGVLDALALLAEHFDPIVIITNQQGIGKKLMTVNDLKIIHRQMMERIEQEGGRIDAIYFAEEHEQYVPYHRKPAPGMALQAKSDFPHIAFHRSVMVGDSESDIAFGRKLGMKSIGIATEHNAFGEEQPDEVFERLFDFSSSLQ